jgi:hypothetical protein
VKTSDPASHGDGSYIFETGVQIVSSGNLTPAFDTLRKVQFNDSSPNAFNIPIDSTLSFPVGTEFDIIQVGSGTTTVQAPAGVGLNNTDGGGAAISAQFGRVKVYKRASNHWLISGDHGAVS